MIVKNAGTLHHQAVALKGALLTSGNMTRWKVNWICRGCGNNPFPPGAAEKDDSSGPEKSYGKRAAHRRQTFVLAFIILALASLPNSKLIGYRK